MTARQFQLVATSSVCLLYRAWGQSWTQTSATDNSWYSVASSATGTHLIAGGATGLYTSTDSGGTWISNNVPSLLWRAVASSADGNTWIAAAHSGGIWTCQLAQAPPMTITRSGGSVVVGWPASALDLALQERALLSDPGWLDVTNAPALNFTNLQSQVLAPVTNESRFYRFKP